MKWLTSSLQLPPFCIDMPYVRTCHWESGIDGIRYASIAVCNLMCHFVTDIIFRSLFLHVSSLACLTQLLIWQELATTSWAHRVRLAWRLLFVILIGSNEWSLCLLPHVISGYNYTLLSVAMSLSITLSLMEFHCTHACSIGMTRFLFLLHSCNHWVFSHHLL